MIEPEGLDRLRRNFHTGDIPLPKGECLDPEIVAALAEGSLDADARARALHHVAQCASCRRAVASVAEALVDGPITHEIDIVDGRRRRSRRVLLGIVVPVAAAVAALFLLRSPLAPLRVSGDDSAMPHRGGGDGDTGVILVRPIGTVAAARLFDWKRVVGSDQYRVTLFDERGTVLYEVQAADSTLILPDSVLLEPGRPYLWRVQARTGWDRWIASDLMAFTIARGPP